MDKSTMNQGVESTFDDRGDLAEQNKNITSCQIKDQELELLTLSCKRTEPKGDISVFEEMFQNWKNHEIQSEATEKDLQQKLDISEKEKEVEGRKVADLEMTVSLLEETINSLHNDLELVDKLGKENTDLKDTVREIEQKLADARKESELKGATYEQKINGDRIIYENHLKTLQDEMETKLQEKDKTFNDMLKEKNEELDEIRKEMETEKQRMTMEFENKVVKLQRQKVTASISQQQSSSANQEIFRKKLQHLKKEQEAEINGLKEQIKKLQDQLTASNSAQQDGTQHKSSVSVSTHQSLFRKSRRF